MQKSRTKTEQAKHSRTKGRRGEYLVRDALRLEGYQADRVPMSGAAQGFKGDVRFREKDKEYTCEVKVRADDFDEIYSFFHHLKEEGSAEPSGAGLSADVMGPMVSLHESMRSALGEGPAIFISYPATHKILKKLFRMQNWLGSCDVLVIKGDRKPLLYIRYHG